MLTNTQAEANLKEKTSSLSAHTHSPQEAKESVSDPEASLPKSSVLNYQTSVVKQAPPKSTGETKKPSKPVKGKQIIN